MGRAVHLEKKGLERQGDFFVLYEFGYPDFNNLMSIHIDEISIFFHRRQMSLTIIVGK